MWASIIWVRFNMNIGVGMYGCVRFLSGWESPLLKERRVRRGMYRYCIRERGRGIG